MSGDVTVTATTMTWTSDAPGNAPNMFTLTLGSAPSYSTEGGQNGIANLLISAQPVGSSFAPFTFITFDVNNLLPALDLSFIDAGIGGSAGCSNPTPAVGQTCTPSNPGGSPFTFTNNQPASSIQSEAQWVFEGVATDGAAWKSDFTAQFGVPFQTVLANLGNPNFSVTNSYSATVTVSPTPEPGPLGMAGFGLGLVILWRVSAVRRRRNRLG